jgi:DNA-binding response OmpR family regulator
MQNLKCILLVEDDPNDAELVRMTLEENKVANQIVHVRDGAEALEYLKGEGPCCSKGEYPALVILDLKLPKLSGLQVLGEIRNNEKLKLLPVVIFTSSQAEQDIIDGYKLGTNGYVVKPLDFHQFVEAVKELGVFWGIINQPPPKVAC